MRSEPRLDRKALEEGRLTLEQSAPLNTTPTRNTGNEKGT